MRQRHSEARKKSTTRRAASGESAAPVPASGCQPLGECLRARLADYFADLDGHPAGNLYRLVMTEVEVPLLEMALGYTDGNLSRAAEVLGINRATLRGKLKHYGLNGR